MLYFVVYTGLFVRTVIFGFFIAPILSTQSHDCILRSKFCILSARGTPRFYCSAGFAFVVLHHRKPPDRFASVSVHQSNHNPRKLKKT